MGSPQFIPLITTRVPKSELGPAWLRLHHDLPLRYISSLSQPVSIQVDLALIKMDTRGNKRQRNNSTNSHAQRTTPSTAPQDPDESPGRIPLASRPAPVPAHESPANSNEAPALEMRSCENCRRGKLKCSRSYPCAKCLDKGLDCVYEQDKRRGPKPGYIEEIYRRIDVLEQMVVGQSLLLRPQHQSSESRVDFRSVVDGTRQMLREAGQHPSRDETTDDANLSQGPQISRVQQCVHRHAVQTRQ